MVMSNEAAAASANFEDSLTRLQGTMGGLKDRMIGELLPRLSQILDGIENFFGIHLPSTLFANLGEFMAMGLGEGFGDEMKSVSEDMQNAIAVCDGNSAYYILAVMPRKTTKGYGYYRMRRKWRLRSARSSGRRALMREFTQIRPLWSAIMTKAALSASMISGLPLDEQPRFPVKIQLRSDHVAVGA